MFSSRHIYPWSYPYQLAICLLLALVTILATAGVGVTVSAAPAQVVVTTSGPGSVTPGTGAYPPGPLTLVATPQPGALFTGWRVDGTVVGWDPILGLTVAEARSINARFAPRPVFSDVASSGVQWDAITQLAARGIINGYGDGTYGPIDPVQRAQIAALIVRALGWDGGTPSGPAPFSDLGGVAPDLQRAIMILVQRGIARGYDDGTFDPNGEVTHAQAISLIARSMVQAGHWTAITAAEDDGTVYPNVPVASPHRLDLLTYVKYAGGIPDRPTNQAWADWEGSASRGWTAQVLWRALDRYFMTNRVLNPSPTPSPSPSPSPSPTASPSPVNNPPVAIADNYATATGTVLSVPTPGVLGNDSDPDGSPLVAVPVAGPTHGALTLNLDGSFTYIPTAGYSGPDSFTYQARDTSNALSAVTTVSLTVTPSAPAIGGISPDAGPIFGGVSVTISGSGFTGATAVSFGATAATAFTVVNDTTITATAPAGAVGTVAVTVATPSGSATANNAFTYYTPPSISTISPTSGPVAGGTTVTIDGSNFTGVTTVTFGTIAATSFTILSDTRISAISPAGTGMVNVAVATPQVGVAVPNGYTYVTGPTIVSVLPSSGPVTGGTNVTINGSGFTGTTSVSFANQSVPFIVNSNTSLTVTTPAHVAGAVDISVTAPTGTVTAFSAYTYTDVPTITGLSQTSGPIAGGTTVTITGTNFTGTMAVTFGGTLAQSFTVISNTQITAVSPMHIPGTVDVTVTTPGGTSATNAAARFYYNPCLALRPEAAGVGTMGCLVGASVTIGGADLSTAMVTTPAYAARAFAVAVALPGGTVTAHPAIVATRRDDEGCV